MRLQFVTETRTERQVLADADVVLDVDAAEQRAVAQPGVADAPRVAARRAGEKVVDRFERVGAEIVRGLVRVVPCAVEIHAGAKRVDAADVVEVRHHVQRTRAASAALLRAAAGLGVDDLDRRQFDRRLPAAALVVVLEPRVDEEAAADRSDLLDADGRPGLVGRIRALELVELSDAEVVVRELLGVEAHAQRLVLRQRVVEVPVAERVLAAPLDRQGLDAAPFRSLRDDGRRVVEVAAVQ